MTDKIVPTAVSAAVGSMLDLRATSSTTPSMVRSVMAFDPPSHASRHELEVVVPAVGARLALIRIPLRVAVFFLCGRVRIVVLVSSGFGVLCRCFFGFGRLFRWRSLSTVLGVKVLAAFAPEAGPGVSFGFAS